MSSPFTDHFVPQLLTRQFHHSGIPFSSFLDRRSRISADDIFALRRGSSGSRISSGCGMMLWKQKMLSTQVSSPSSRFSKLKGRTYSLPFSVSLIAARVAGFALIRTLFRHQFGMSFLSASKRWAVGENEAVAFFTPLAAPQWERSSQRLKPTCPNACGATRIGAAQESRCSHGRNTPSFHRNTARTDWSSC